MTAVSSSDASGIHPAAFRLRRHLHKNIHLRQRSFCRIWLLNAPNCLLAMYFMQGTRRSVLAKDRIAKKAGKAQHAYKSSTLE